MFDDSALIEKMFQSTGGVAVVFGGVTTYGHFDTADELVHFQASVKGAAMTLRYPTAKLSALGVGDTIEVGGTDYEVREGPLRESDGAVSVVLLADA